MLFSVGMAGFEPTTSSTPCWRDTGLRYIPIKYSRIANIIVAGIIQNATIKKEAFDFLPDTKVL